MDASEPVAAAYSGACVAGIVPALLTGHPHDPLPGWIPGPAQGARTVVLLVLDGLGWDALGDHPGALATLAGLEGGPITTVVPSTTASAR